ncbi:MAG: hypothetical protein V4494_08240 [Chlamydiota bacterium]
MNRSKRPLAKQDLKLGRKAIRLAQRPQPVDVPLKSDTLKPLDLLKKYPTKNAQKKAAVLATLRKQLAIKKIKKQRKISKRTNVGVDAESPPKSIHVEGGRWMKTLVKQNLLKRKSLTKRLSKR